MAGAKRDIISLETAIESRAADSKHFAGDGFVSSRLLENAKNRHALQIRESGGRKRGCVLPGCAGILDAADGGRKVREVNRPTVSEGNGPRDAIFEFAHVSRPVILEKTFHHGRSDLDVFSRRVTVEKAVGQLRNIGAPLAQAGQMHG